MKTITKKGNIVAIIYLMLILFLLLIGGVMLIFGAVIIDWVFDEAVPELSNLGVVGDANLTEYSKYSISPVNTVVQSFIWLAGVFYVLGLMGVIGFAFAFRFTGNKWLMGFFFACMLMLIMSSIFMSNIYEEFYTGTDEVGTRLKEHELLSYLILYSPLVFSVIGFICGIIMFTGEGGEEAI
jgi:hypothetical protein